MTTWLLLLLLLLACPLMMIFMMRGMHGGHGTSGESQGGHPGDVEAHAAAGRSADDRIAQLEREVARLHALQREPDDRRVQRS